MPGTTAKGIRHPDGATKAHQLGAELKTFADDVDRYVTDNAVRGFPGLDGRDGRDGRTGDKGDQGLSAPDVLPTVEAVAGWAGNDSPLQDALDARFTRSALQPANVMDAPYYATGDGITDDTAAIQAALNDSPIVYLPHGTYVASGLILKANQTLYGDGAGASIILHDVGNDCLAATGTAGTPLSNITVRGLEIVATGNSTNQRGVYFQHVTDGTLDALKISGCGNNGVNLYYARRFKILNSEVTKVRNFGILVYRSNDVVVQGCDLHHITTPDRANLGLQFKSSQNCQALNNRINNITGYGFYTWDDSLDLVNHADRDHIVAGNQIHTIASGTGGFAGTGIYINVTTGARVTGNTATDCQVNSIVVAAATGAIVEGNRCAGNTAAAGIGLALNTRHSRVSSNIISGYDQGIVIDGSHYNRVEGNSVYNLRASASSLAAGIRIRNNSNNNSIVSNQCIDDQSNPTMRRGIYNESGAFNIFAFNVAAGSTTGNIAIVGSNTQFANTGTLTDNPLPIGDANAKVGFFGKAPVTRPAATADAASIRAALVALGLLTP